MASVGGALELIGVRAVILDFRQYMNQGRQMEAATNAVGRATENVEKSSLKAASAQTALAGVEQSRIQGNARLAASITAVAAAQDRLKLSQGIAAQARPQDPTTGRFISRQTAGANVTRDAEALRIAQQEQQLIRAGIPTLASQNAARAAATKAIDAQAAATLKLQGSEEKEISIAQNRTKLLTTSAAVLGAAATVGIGIKSIQAASSYETTLAKINALTDISAEDTQKLGKEILNLTKEVPQSPDELGAAAYFVLSSGIKSVDEALAITKLSAKDATSGLGSAADVARVLTAVINAYGQDNITAAQASDILVQAVKEGSAEASDFAGSLGRVLGTASNLGVKFTDLTATIASLTNVGLNADEATTAVLGILNQLTKSTPDAEAALKGVGLTMTQLRQSIQDKGFVATMYDLAKAFQGNSAALHPLLPEVRGLNGFVTAFTVQGQKTAQVLESINSAGGATDTAFQKVSKTFAVQTGLLKNELNVALIEIGSAILPSVTQAVKDLIVWIDKNHAAIQNLTTQGLETLIQILKDVGTGIGFVTDLLSFIPSNEAAITASVVAIGLAFSWAFPGGQLIKGLTIAIALLGQLDKGVNVPLLGQVGGEQSKTGERGIGGKPSVQGEIADILKGQNQKFLGINFNNGALASLTPGFLQSDEYKKAREIVDKLSKEGIKSFEEFQKLSPAKLRDIGAITQEEFDKIEKSLTGTNTAAKDSRIQLPDLARNVGAVTKGSKVAAEELKKFAQEFKNTSDAAADVESLTSKLKLFGEIGPDLAKGFDLNATTAGAVQATDAIIRALDKADNAEFQRVKVLSTVANLVEQNAREVADKLVLGLARGALEASQKAASSLFGTTREVANLNVPLAQNRLKAAQVSLVVNPQLDALNNLMKSLDHQAKIISERQKQQEKERTQRDNALKASFDRQNRVLEDQLDALKYSNLLAKNAYEVQQQQLQDLIDANKKSISDLQAAFLKNNEDLQNQINKAIGAGNSQTALDLVKQQQAATSNFRNQNTALGAAGTGLTDQQKAADRAEKAREREATLAEAKLEQDQKQLKRQQDNIEATNKQNDDLKDLSNSTEQQTAAIDKQKSSIQEQIDALQGQKDATDQQGQRIQEQIAVYQAQSDVLKAQVEAADKTLLTQDEQRQMAEKLIAQIGFESEAIRNLTANTDQLNPNMAEANQQFATLKGAIRSLVDNDFRQKFITEGLDPAAIRLGILTTATEKAAAGIDQMAASVSSAVTQIDASVASTTDALSQHLSTGQTKFDFNDPLSQHLSTGRRSFAVGGFTGSEGGLVHPNEVVIPLNDFARASEILKKLPSNLLNIIRGETSGGSNAIGGYKTLVKGPIGSLKRGDQDPLYGANLIGPGGLFDPEGKLSGHQGTILTTGGWLPEGADLSRYAAAGQLNAADLSKWMASHPNGKTNQVMGQLPAGFMASLAKNNGGGSRPIFGDMNVQGFTIEDMRAAAHREVDNAFNKASSAARRGGSLISSGVSGNNL